MGWEQLKSIADSNRRQAREDRKVEAGTCPIDGAILDYNVKTGELNCPLGNYRVRRGPRGA